MIVNNFSEFTHEVPTIFLEDIREGRPQAFTRIRKATPLNLINALNVFTKRHLTIFQTPQFLYCARKNFRYFDGCFL
ncbi:hypothetical protein JZO67_002300 [Enterococcus sp. 665A]|uniref:Uncharacterized protein n=1 Tax=Candidatus Enterococcus ferrettii TaxID=2815324 RepID=A0ABV0EP04_9ENTE